jgi:hypothetical protein
MTSSTIQKEMMWRGFTAMRDAHTVLAERCVRFLSFFDDGDGLATAREQDAEVEAFLKYSAAFWSLHVRESNLCDDERAAIAPLTFRLCDLDVSVYPLWAEIYWKQKYMSSPEFRTRLMVACYLGHVAVAKQSLENGADVNAQDGYYGNAL